MDLSIGVGILKKIDKQGQMSMAGHAIHFLERLKRANETQMKLAMELYHRPHLVRLILEIMAPPAGTERLALSISPEDKGPFVVVSRTGAFVTCLGEAMSTGDLYVVSYERLESYLRRVEELKARGEYIEETLDHLDPKEHFDYLLNRKGWQVSREDILALSTLHPVLKYDALIRVDTFVRAIARAEAAMLRQKRITAPEHSLKVHWNASFSIGHNLVYALMFGPKGLEKFLETDAGMYLQEPFRLGQLSFAARALFATAKAGRYGIPVCQRCLEVGGDPTFWLFGIMGLVVIGLRHQRLRSQAKRIFEKALQRNADRSYTVQLFQQKLGKRFLTVLATALKNEQMVHEHALKGFQKALFSAQKYFQPPPASPFHFDAPEQIPEDLAHAYALSALADIRIKPQMAELLASSIPWIARCEAEDLYLPRAFNELRPFKWDRTFSEYLIDNLKEWYTIRTPAISPQRPGRNAPCHCGSGLKYKKCCRAKDDAEDAMIKTRMVNGA